MILFAHPPSFTCKEKSKVGGVGRGKPGRRGEEAELGGLLLPCPLIWTPRWSCLLPFGPEVLPTSGLAM